MRKSKRVIALALAAVMSVSVFAGCNNNNNETTPANTPTSGSNTPTSGSNTPSTEKKEPPFKLSILLPYGDHAYDDEPQTKEFRRQLQEKTNTEITWELYDSVTYYEKLTLKYASGELASIMVTSETDPAFLNACQYNVFWAVDGYFDLFKNLSAIPESIRKAASMYGKVYGVPRARGNFGRVATVYRQDWADALNLGSVDTIDDLYEMAVAFTYDDPDGNGQADTYAFAWDQWWDGIVHHMVWFGVPNVWGLDDSGNLEYYALTPEFKTALNWLRRVNSEGLAPSDWSERGAGKARGAYVNNGMCGIYTQCADDARKAFGSLVGKEDEPGPVPTAQFTFISAPKVNGEIRVRPFGAGYAGLLSISKSIIKTEDELMKVLAFIDNCANGDVQMLIDKGIEGQDWERDEEGYLHVFETDERTAMGLGSGKYRDGYNQLLCYFNSPEEALKLVNKKIESEIEIKEQAIYAENLKYLVPNQGAGYTSATFVAQGTDLDKIISDAVWGYIKGEIEEVALDNAIEQWKEAGGLQVIEEMNEQYKIYNAD